MLLLIPGLILISLSVWLDVLKEPPIALLQPLQNYVPCALLYRFTKYSSYHTRNV